MTPSFHVELVLYTCEKPDKDTGQEQKNERKDEEDLGEVCEGFVEDCVDTLLEAGRMTFV